MASREDQIKRYGFPLFDEELDSEYVSTKLWSDVPPLDQVGSQPVVKSAPTPSSYVAPKPVVTPPPRDAPPPAQPPVQKSSALLSKLSQKKRLLSSETQSAK